MRQGSHLENRRITRYPRRMNSKRILIWAIAHLIIASIVADDLRRRGKTEDEAKLGGHLAGTASGYLLSRVL